MDEKAFSSIDFVSQCLLDNERSNAFNRAIVEIVRPEHTVLDVGTGSGIMALFAARAGAKKVYALEFDPYVAAAAQKNFSNNEAGKNIEIILDDARSCNFKEGLHFDVVVMEMLTTGMVDEFQVQAINNLYAKGVVSDKTIFIPSIQKTLVSLTNIDCNRYGFLTPMVWHLWKWHNWSDVKIETRSVRELLHSIDFRSTTPEEVDSTLQIRATESGVINSICLFSTSVLSQNESLDDTESLNAPVIVPLEKPVSVLNGQIVKVRVKYRFGWGYKNFTAQVLE